MPLAPIALFVYNRLEHTKKTVEALQKNNLATESELFVFSDSWKSEEGRARVEEVRTYIKTISGFKKVEVVERNENFGLAKSIISGVTELVSKYGKVIVLEDDLVTSPYFLKYMNEALDMYTDNNEIISIHGYMYPIKSIYSVPGTSFIKGADCWGWATWKRGWDLFEKNGQKLLDELESKNLTTEFDFAGSYPFTHMLEGQIAGKNSSWAIRWYASAFLKNKLTLYPNQSLVQNVGMDGSGRHSGITSAYDSVASQKPVVLEKQKLIENAWARKEMINYFNSLKPSPIRRIVDKIKKYV
jgi:hypothetical protein